MNMIAGTDQPNLPDTHYIDNRIFTDESIFTREQETIFATAWLFVAHETEITNPGDYRVCSVSGKPVLLVRGEDGIIRGFYNVCRHRGAPVVRDDAGNTDGFQCFYHLWTYGLDGRCTGVSKPDGYASVKLDRADYPLISVRVDVLAGLVFVCLSDETESLEEFVGDIIEPVRGPLSDTPLKVFHYHKANVATNWKLWQDNNSERYHSLMHFINRKTMPWVIGKSSPMKLNIFGNGHSGYWSDGSATVDYDAGNYDTVSIGTLPNMIENEMRVINLFPDAMVNIRSNVIRIDRMVPVKPGHTIIEWRGLGQATDNADLVAEQLRHHNMYWGPAGRNLGEDTIAVEEQWAALNSGIMRYSIIAREEELNPTDDANVRAYYQEWGKRMGRPASAPFSVTTRTAAE